MPFASLSIYGLYEFDNTLFDNLNLPDGMDEDILIPEILTECSDFTLLYPNFDFMKMLIGVWSSKELHVWTKLWESEQIEYNPIENYDRYESIARNVASQSSGSSSSSGSAGTSGRSKDSASKTAFDSDTLKTIGGSESQNNTSSISDSKEQTEGAASGAETVTSHIHGNIGVTTAAQMIEGFREVSKFCTYDYIVQSFKNRFCLQIY